MLITKDMNMNKKQIGKKIKNCFKKLTALGELTHGRHFLLSN